ncbi:MAG: hypothetical protein AAGD35_23700, partial [Actinomycetota bacterium]
FPANYPAYGSAAGLMSVIAVGATAFAIRGLVRSYPAPSPDHMVSAAPAPSSTPLRGDVTGDAGRT